MKANRLPLTAAALIFAVAVAHANDGNAPQKTQFVAVQKAKPKATAKDAPEKKPRKFRGRLPAYYGQIGLSEKQRSAIYGIQLTYRDEIQKLEKQLRELRAKQGDEIEAVLTPAQKKKLAELLEAARKKRAARSKKTPKANAKKTDKAA